MSEAKRYTMGNWPNSHEYPHGEWVKYDDHVAIVAQLSARINELEQIKTRHMQAIADLDDNLASKDAEIEELREALNEYN